MILKNCYLTIKGNLKIGSVINIIIIEVTMIIYYHYPVQLRIAIVEFLSHVFDNYDINVKNALLLNSLTGKFESQISWNWHDWNYIGDNSKNKKKSLKKMLLYILHVQYMLMKIQIQIY